MTMDWLLADRLAMLLVITGMTLATCMAVPLATPFVVTMAVKSPAEGLVENVTVKEVAVAPVTEPIAPLLKVTLLLELVVSKPVPLIVIADAFAARLATAAVTVGLTAAIWTAAPLLMEFVVTTAVKLPAEGLVPKLTVSDVADAEVTVPTAPLLKATVLFAAMRSNATPLMTTVVALVESATALTVTDGVTRAT